MRKVIRTSDAPHPIGVYSQGIVSQGLVFVSSQIAINPATGEIEPGDIKSETRRVLRNMEGILRASGSTLRDAVKLGVFISDLKDFPAMNEVFKEFFPDNPPARTTVQAVLPRNLKIEIDCVAVQGKKRKR